MSIYRGSLGEISNKADWTSPAIVFEDSETSNPIDPSVADEIYFEIKHPETRCVLASANLGNGITIASNENIVIQLPREKLLSICEGQYLANFSITIDGEKHDPLLATITILEGAGQ